MTNAECDEEYYVMTEIGDGFGDNQNVVNVESITKEGSIYRVILDRHLLLSNDAVEKESLEFKVYVKDGHIVFN